LRLLVPRGGRGRGLGGLAAVEREDDLFPTGLVTPDLTAAYPVLKTWQAWGMARRPTPDAPPPARSGC
jgi:hypothetical protein